MDYFSQIIKGFKRIYNSRNNPEPMDIDVQPSTSGLQNINISKKAVKRKDIFSSDSESDGEIQSKKNKLPLKDVFTEVDNSFGGNKRKRMILVKEQDVFVEIESAFNGNVKTYFLKNKSTDVKDICMLLSLHMEKMKTVLLQNLQIFNAIKFNIMLECTYEKPLLDEKQDRAFKTKNHSLFYETDIDTLIHSLITKICEEESNYEGRGSGWSLLRIDGILLKVNRYRPLRGNTYLPLSSVIEKKKAVINIQNFDNECFKWAVLCHFVTGKNRQQIDFRYHNIINRFNFNGITFPTPLKQIKVFEKNNLNISINVYGLNESNEVFPLRISKKENLMHIDLLFISNNEGLNHYCYISNFSRLASSQLSKRKHKTLFCKSCLTHFSGPSKKKQLEGHKEKCLQNKPVRVIMPEKQNLVPPVLRFSNFQNTFKLPLVLYADFESILKPVNEQISKYTYLNSIHEPMSFCVYLVCSNDIPLEIRNALPLEPYLYRGADAAKHFMSYVVDLTNHIGELIEINTPMKPLTDDENKRVTDAKCCELCQKPFTSIYRPQRDHCHLTGLFRAVLCNSCNLNRQAQRNIPIFIHGSANYDTHFIVKQLGFDKRYIGVIPNSTEKYITFTKQTSSGITIRFIDTYKIMSSSLSALVKNLPKENFIHIRKFFSEQDMHLVTRKGVYPYEYTSCWEKLNETRLPPMECFNSSLNNTVIDNIDYQHALDVWSHFDIKTLGEYSDLYLKLDVLLLSDVFENFRELCLNSYALDCAHYITLPGFSFDAMLKYTNIEIELLTDYNIYLFIESGIRGGITSCITRNAVANNHYMGELYNPKKETSYLTYVDCNNLYGWAMVQPIPLNNFSWYTGDLCYFDVTSIPDNSNIGYFLEVDIEYPNNLHDSHNELPFLPVSECPPNSKQKKLVTTLKLKKNYVCHYINLKQALSHGLVLKKIHKVVQFNQSCWLKSYIDLNTEKRQQAVNAFQKDFYKLLNNSLFGKTIENVRKRINLELVSSEKRLLKLINKPNFLDRIIYDTNLSAIQCEKETIYLNKPIFIGFSVLELSKTRMYDFHYNIMKKKYGSKIKILYIDTDCFFYQITSNDLYKDLCEDDEFNKEFDLSDYPVNHKCFNASNKKVIGKFKDECNSIIILEFIGLRPKLYCFKTLQPLSQIMSKEPCVQKKAKGVTKRVINNNITFNDYKNCLENDLTIRKEMSFFRSKKHNIETITVNKIVLNARDDKRYICDDGINTLAYNHYLLIGNTSFNDDDDDDDGDDNDDEI